MALAKVYDTSETLMVPIDAEGSGDLLDNLRIAIAKLENEGFEFESVSEIADAIEESRTAAGLDS